MSIKFFYPNKTKGQSMVEVIVSLGLFAIVIAAFSGLMLTSFDTYNRSLDSEIALGLSLEAHEALRWIKASAWNKLEFNRSAIDSSGSNWDLSGEGSTEIVGKHTRIIDFLPVYRESNGALTTASDPAGDLDILSKEVALSVSWPLQNGQTKTHNETFYLSAWDAAYWEQDSWAGGDGELVWSDSGRFNTANDLDTSVIGEISLDSVSSTSLATSGYLESAAYNNDLGTVFAAIFTDHTIPLGCDSCRVSLFIKTAPDNGGSPGTWTAYWSGTDGIDEDEVDYYEGGNIGQLIHTDHNGSKWIKYKVLLEGDGSNSPVVNNVKIYYQ